MKSAPVALAMLATGLAVAPARAEPPETAPTLLEVAASDARLKTFAALVSRAGLTETLAQGGPFTVFAPTNEAFARLPKEVLGALTREDRQVALRQVLLGHVLEGRILASDLLPTRRAETLTGSTLPLRLRVGEADVLEADLVAANGVIHVVDRVLLPTTDTAAPQDLRVRDVLRTAIERGVPVYNEGDPEACADIYAEAARRLTSASAPTAPLHRLRLEAALAEEGDASTRAWALRRTFDGILADLAFEPRIEASLPAGFPRPGKVGEVVVKSYPRYRAARTQGGNEFWRLFRHIKSNDVAMTAPVEMTMDEGLRMVDMAFLYERPGQGAAGSDGDVSVLDIEAATVLSVGVRGGRGPAAASQAKRVLEAAMEEGGWVPAGPYRMLGYNSPMVPTSERYWELQVPVRR